MTNEQILKKAILTPKDLENYGQSTAHEQLITFINNLAVSVQGKTLRDGHIQASNVFLKTFI